MTIIVDSASHHWVYTEPVVLSGLPSCRVWYVHMLPGLSGVFLLVLLLLVLPCS